MCVRGSGQVGYGQSLPTCAVNQAPASGQETVGANAYRTSPPGWRSTGRSIGSQRSQTIGQIIGARCHDVGKDRDATPVAGVYVGVVLHQQINHLGSGGQCAVQAVQRRPAVLIACVRRTWIVRQQRAKPVRSIAANLVTIARPDV
jgi:hypothetical protein